MQVCKNRIHAQASNRRFASARQQGAGRHFVGTSKQWNRMSMHQQTMPALRPQDWRRLEGEFSMCAVSSTRCEMLKISIFIGLNCNSGEPPPNAATKPTPGVRHRAAPSRATERGLRSRFKQVFRSWSGGLRDASAKGCAGIQKSGKKISMWRRFRARRACQTRPDDRNRAKTGFDDLDSRWMKRRQAARNGSSAHAFRCRVCASTGHSLTADWPCRPSLSSLVQRTNRAWWAWPAPARPCQDWRR